MIVRHQLLRLFIVLPLLWMSLPSYAVRYQSGDFVFDCNYSFNQLTATLLRYVGASSEVTIPETVFYDGNTYPVIYIGDEFSAPFRDNATVRTIHLPNSATSISVESFSNCAVLESVTLGRQLKHIEAYAFYHCPQLREVKIYHSLTDVGDYAFAECPALSTLTLGRGVIRLGSHVFDETPVEELTLLNPIPAECAGSLSGQSQWYTTCEVHIHIGSKAAFASSNEWSRFSHLLEVAEWGDVNADGNTDIVDVNILINCLLGRLEADLSLDDINHDDILDISDVNQLINIILGRVDL